MTDTLRIDFLSRLAATPFIATLRGVQHAEVVEIAEALVATGITLIEITVDSPEPYFTMEKLALRISDQVMICAGNVLTREQATDAANAGGRVIFSPIFTESGCKSNQGKTGIIGARYLYGD